MSPFEYPELSDPTDEDFAMNPTPSPAPRGELSASFVLASIKTELLKRSQDCGAIGDFIPLLEDKVESLTKRAAAISKENQRLRGEIDQLVMERDHFHDERDTLREENESLKREVGELNRRLEEQHKLYCEETKRHNETWAKIHAATGYLNKEFKKLPEDLLEAVKEVVFRVTLVEIGRDNLRADLTALRQWTEQAREAMAALVGLGRKDTGNPKYDGYYKTAQELIDSHPAQGMEGRG